MRTGTGIKRVMETLGGDKCSRWEGRGAEDQVTWGGGQGLSPHLGLSEPGKPVAEYRLPGFVGQTLCLSSQLPWRLRQKVCPDYRQFKTSLCKTKSKKNTGLGLTGTALA